MNKINLFGEEWKEITKEEYKDTPMKERGWFGNVEKDNLVYFRKVKPKIELPKTFGTVIVKKTDTGEIGIFETVKPYSGYIGSPSYPMLSINDYKNAIAYAEKFYEQEQGEKK